MASSPQNQDFEDSCSEDDESAAAPGLFGRIGALFKRKSNERPGHGPQVPPTPLTYEEQQQAERLLMYHALKDEFDKDPELRQDCPGLFKVEKTLNVLGKAGVENMPRRVLRIAVTDFDAYMHSTSSPGLIALRAFLVLEANETSDNLGSIQQLAPVMQAGRGAQTFGPRPTDIMSLPVLSATPSGTNPQRNGATPAHQDYDHAQDLGPEDDDPDADQVMHLGTAADFQNSRTAEPEVLVAVSRRAQARGYDIPGAPQTTMPAAAAAPVVPPKVPPLHRHEQPSPRPIAVSIPPASIPAAPVAYVPPIEEPVVIETSAEEAESLADDYFTPGVGQVALGPEVMESNDLDAFNAFSNSMPAMIEIDLEGELSLPTLQIERKAP